MLNPLVVNNFFFKTKLIKIIKKEEFIDLTFNGIQNYRNINRSKGLSFHHKETNIPLPPKTADKFEINR